MPSHCRQLLLIFLVSLLVPANLLHPEVTVCRWNFATGRVFQLAQFHKMTMPETAVNKDASPVFSQYQIRMPRQPLVIKPKTETSLPQSSTHYHLWLGILRTNRRHVLIDAFWREFYHGLNPQRYFIYKTFYRIIQPRCATRHNVNARHIENKELP